MLYTENSQKKLKQAWKNFLINREENKAIRPEVLEAWKRCIKQDVDPFIKSASFIDHTELTKRMAANKNLVEIGYDTIKYLYQFLRSGFLVSVCDKDGILLITYGDNEIETSALQGNGTVGTNWGENMIGNNPAGTAIVTDKPVQIVGYEHFCICSHNWAGSGAPIHDPLGNIIGSVSVMGKKETTNLHTLGIAVMTSYAIEKQLTILQNLEKINNISNHSNIIIDSISEGIAVLDSSNTIIQINKVLCEMLSLSEDSFVGENIKSIIKDKMVLQLINEHQGITDFVTEIFVEGIRFPCTVTFRLITDTNEGILLINEISRARKLAKKIGDTEAKVTFDDLIGKNEKFLKMIRETKLAAQTEANVLLLGDSGTGKDLLAQAIHNSSNRRNGPFVPINCGAIPKELIASELFGYVGGAFTGAKPSGSVGKFEIANGGTIFLDEIGEMPIELQATLLRVIENKVISRVGGGEYFPCDIRIIAATNKDLLYAIDQGEFRQDLYYRLNILQIWMVPLVERKGDIQLLTEHFIKRFNNKYKKAIKIIPEETKVLLNNYSWPGNVRELQNAIERAVILSQDEYLQPYLLPDETQNKTRYSTKRRGEIIHSEENYLRMLLDENKWNITKVSHALGVARSTIYRKMALYNIKK